MKRYDTYSRYAAACHMGRWLILVLMALMVHTAAWAQSGLSVAQIFDRYGHERGCKMVTMSNTTLKGYRLALYRSLVYKSDKVAVASYLEADRRRARKVREVVEDGRVTSGYYMMQPQGGHNRYILFSHNGAGRGTVIYIEGTLTPDDIMRLCYTKR